LTSTRFHIAFPVNDLETSREFYTQVLGCSIGRETENWIDFNLYGHQLVAHLSPSDCLPSNKSLVDGDQIPVRHFGLILPWNEWGKLCKSFEDQELAFYIKPKIRFANKKGEQGTFFLNDPSGNILEFKSFKDFNFIFKK